MQSAESTSASRHAGALPGDFVVRRAGRGLPPRRLVAGALPMLLTALLAAAALGQPAAVTLDVMVVHTSGAEGGVADDPRARKAHGILGGQIKYNSLKVLDSKSRKVALNEIWKVMLPNGKHFLVQPLNVAGNGVLVAVDLEGSAQVDARIKRKTPFVVGPQSHQGGNLSVILEADY